MIALEKEFSSLTGILSSFGVLLDCSTFTALPMKRIFCPRLAGIYDVGNIDNLSVNREFQSSAIMASSSFSAMFIERMLWTTFLPPPMLLDMPETEVMSALVSPYWLLSAPL